MKHAIRLLLIGLAFLAATGISRGDQQGALEFTVSMERPHRHYYHVLLRCQGLGNDVIDFKLPAWTPGYYRIMDYARNVLNFRVENEAGTPLAWEKTAKNTWRVETGGEDTLLVSYDIYAFTRSVADSFLDDRRAFISPTGVFIHPAELLQHPVTVRFIPSREGAIISTGLDPVEGREGMFYAPDFNVLYDCPVLIGDHEILRFDHEGIPHVIAVEELGAFDRDRFVADIRRVVQGTVRLMGGDIPYRHYTFIMMDQGGGGLEHLNSMAVFSNSASWSSPRSYQGWLSFIAHEYYHLYNVKRIRPIALGPFDYDRENYTRLLWVSEGISVYYQDIILKRAGILTQDEYFERVRSFIRGYENRPGRLFQSVTESSYDTWMKFFSRNENSVNTTISYYDKGAALGLLLDLKIRHETENQTSLDDVMRTLYETYHKEKGRGFTDAEFREACERAAGVPLSEIFEEYAPTVAALDYPKYLAYAGLEIDATTRIMPGVYFGAVTRAQEGNLMIASVEWDSPAQRGGLSARDEILALDGIRAAERILTRLLEGKKPGDTLRILLARRGRIQEAEIMLGERLERSFRIEPVPNPDPLQAMILEDWLRRW
jgi:predicted metalloprotease with PDZ domain